ncbi:hypothetical protein FHS61_002268 [Altererythrobacter atlanticus]|uniref:Uncharacterized protein n=1 Tax=Croceibacterium atlanticum TaxID=1267766 RepID=A0A0F7KRE2_9SPHN|nr:hypothetical protein [Croceibacterium atlanticum]AKH41777.1 hypothetical protein WYH_00723 [Croceibacterium atlanticum]MBB5733242.1 hypothetical protein [Croceibacterium atlanticum]
MRRSVLLAGAALALSSSWVLAAPESLLPPSFSNPAPSPTPSPTPRATGTQSPLPGQAPVPSPTQSPVIQPLPGIDTGAGPSAPVALSEDFPSLAELEQMDPDEIDDVLGLKPKFDVPPAARRAVRRVGLIGPEEGGFPVGSLAGQPAALIRAAIEGTEGPLVSRWGHILLRRALASRLNAPADMDPVEFAALRASLLNRMGEPVAARSIVQDIDSDNYDAELSTAALDAYLATGDLLGMCPVARLQPGLRNDADWELTRQICAAYAGEARSAERELNRALGRGTASRIDVLLAQRFAGAATEGRRAVNIQWDDVEELTPFRFGLARALGIDVPEQLTEDAASRFVISDALIPAVPLSRRATSSRLAAERGIFSSSAMVDLYSQLWSTGAPDAEERDRAATLREAYVASAPADRLAAMRRLWDDGSGYGNQVLTAYAAARLPVTGELSADAGRIIASMLTAGLDRNAMRWADSVDEGSEAWALLALASPTRSAQFRASAVDSFHEADESPNRRKSRFLLAGLAGLGRLDSGDIASFSSKFGVDLERASPWSRKIDRAGELRNGALVALLAGVGMQGSGWNRMTARQLYHIVRALDRAGLNAEARMIAAEAVARA